MADFSVDVVHGDAQRAVVVPAGELDVFTGPQLAARMNESVDAGADLVVLDMSELTFIDSSGLGVLVAALKRARSAGGDVVLRSPTPQTLKLLELTGLTRVFSIEGDGQATPPKGQPAAV